jgi:hypothetical protein
MHPKVTSSAHLRQILPFEMQIPTSGEVEQVDRTETLALSVAVLFCCGARKDTSVPRIDTHAIVPCAARYVVLWLQLQDTAGRRLKLCFEQMFCSTGMITVTYTVKFRM